MARLGNYGEEKFSSKMQNTSESFKTVKQEINTQIFMAIFYMD